MFSIYFRKHRDEKKEKNLLTLVIKKVYWLLKSITSVTLSCVGDYFVIPPEQRGVKFLELVLNILVVFQINKTYIFMSDRTTR